MRQSSAGDKVGRPVTAKTCDRRTVRTGLTVDISCGVTKKSGKSKEVQSLGSSRKVYGTSRTIKSSHVKSSSFC